MVFTGVPGLPHYAAAKGGINSMAKSVAVELGAYGVRCNVVCPGNIPTNIGGDDAAAVQHMVDITLARTPIKQIRQPNDLQGIAAYLASDMSRFLSGDTITLDSGMMVQCY